MINKKLCVVIPYRDRSDHLKALLPRLKQSLEKDNIDYKILVVEQNDGKIFNRGYVKNIGAKWAIIHGFDYICFHDVDQLPVLERADYTYENSPVHLAREVEQFGYEILYPNFFGGVVLMTVEHIKITNGYTNDYWGWGAEDGCLRERCTYNGLEIKRRNGRYNSIDHERDLSFQKINKEKLDEMKMNQSISRNNGINSLDYEILSEKDLTFNGIQYKKIKVELN